MRRWLSLVAMIAVSGLLGAACSSDDVGSDDSASDDSASDQASDDEPAPDAGPSPCPEQGFVGEISRLANAGHGDGSMGTADVVSEGVLAFRLIDGGHYTMYVGDHAYDGDPREGATVTAAPGGMVATLSLGQTPSSRRANRSPTATRGLGSP